MLYEYKLVSLINKKITSQKGAKWAKAKGSLQKKYQCPKSLKNSTSLVLKKIFFFNDDQSRIMEGKLV